MLIDLDEAGIGVYFKTPWERAIIRAAWENGEITSAEAHGLVYMDAARTTVIAFLNRCVKAGLLNKEPSPRSATIGLEYLYRAKPLNVGIMNYGATEIGFKNYLTMRFSDALEKEEKRDQV